MIVRRELPSDRAAVAAVHTAAFGGQVRGAPRRPLHGEVAEARLVEELRADGDAVPGLSLVAVLDGQVVGHVLCSRGRVGTRPLLGLAPLGVLPALHGRGVGQALVHAVLGGADALDEPGVVLLGDPGYYRRFGFGPAGPEGIAPPDPAWGEHFQLRRLTSWDDAVVGPYAYAPAFSRL